MKTILKFDIELQRQIITIGLDDFSPNSVLPNVSGGQYGSTPHGWRKEVIEFIRRMLAAELIAPLPGREGYQAKSVEEICYLLEHGDSANDFDAELLWDVIHFGGTRKLTELLKALKLDNWDARNNELSRSLLKTLVDMGVVVL